MMTTRAARLGGILVACLAAGLLAAPAGAQTQSQYFPTIPIPGVDQPDPTVSWSVPYVAYQYTYDNDVFRVPTAQVYPQITTLIPKGVSVADHINTGSAGVDGHWVVSQQSIDYDFEVDKNSYVRNSDLNNTSGLAKVLWNWSLATDFYGQLGGTYTRNLTGFVDSLFFQRDIIDRQEYFANGRYQIGPHLAVYGGVDDSYTKNLTYAERFNDLNYATGKVGLELATSQLNTVAIEYDYANGHYPNPVNNCSVGALPGAACTTGQTTNGVVIDPDFNQDTLSILFKYSPTDKTLLTGDAGYLIRDYPNNPDHPHVGQFSGDIWHLKGQWQPTDKTTLQVTASRDLLAYTFAQADYFVQTGVTLSPIWAQTDKLTWILAVSWLDQNYLPASAGYATIPGVPLLRHDTITAQQAGLQYTPIRALVLTFDYRHELRTSTITAFSYNDSILNAGAKFKF